MTAEPLPSRLASIARGTGEVDAVYHIAYDALDASVTPTADPEQADAWREVTGHRAPQLAAVTDSDLIGGWPVDRVVDRAQSTAGASCASWASARAFCAASAPGAVERASRNEQVVGSIPTGGST